MVLDLLNDSADEVRSTAQRVLLPLFVDWADDFDWLFTKVLTKFLGEIEATLSTTDDQRLLVLFSAIKSIVSFDIYNVVSLHFRHHGLKKVYYLALLWEKTLQQNF
jgi:hypothetical protein